MPIYMGTVGFVNLLGLDLRKVKVKLYLSWYLLKKTMLLSISGIVFFINKAILIKDGDTLKVNICKKIIYFLVAIIFLYF
jgi:hypothetical protein